MIRVNLQTGELADVPVPQFLIGLASESLADLSWTDPSLEVSEYGFLSEHIEYPQIDNAKENLGAKVMKLSDDKTHVISTFEVVALSDDEIEQRKVQSNQRRINEINQRLTQIDLDSVRPLRAVTAGTANDFDKQKLAKLDTEANELRNELKALVV